MDADKAKEKADREPKIRLRMEPPPLKRLKEMEKVNPHQKQSLLSPPPKQSLQSFPGSLGGLRMGMVVTPAELVDLLIVSYLTLFNYLIIYK